MTDNRTAKVRTKPWGERRWAEWYQMMYPKVYYAAFRIARGNADLAGDLTQSCFESFLKYDAIDRMTSDAHALKYLIVTCKRIAIRFGRRERETVTQEIDELELQPDPASVERDIDLEDFLSKLRPDDRRLLEWTLSGFGLAEIAKKLGVTYTAAGVRLHRLKKRFSKVYEV